MINIDEALAVPSAGKRTLNELRALVQHALELQAQIEEHEQQAKRLRKQWLQLVLNTLPDEMTMSGVPSFETEGHKISINNFVRGSLPSDADQRTEALRWLEQHDSAAIIKNNVNALFGLGEHDLMQRAIRELNRLGVEYTNKRDVHHGTLAKAVKEMRDKGVDVPFDLLGLYAGREAVIKEVK
jgi:hypothetical protein